MRLRLLIILLIGLSGLDHAFAQLQSLTYDFGRVKDWNNEEAVFQFTNTSEVEQEFLLVAYRPDVKVWFDDVVLQPGQTTNIHVLYYTEEFGSFSKSVNVFLSYELEPLTLTITGNIRSFHPNALTYCPVMTEDRTHEIGFQHVIKVVDDISREGIGDFSYEVNSSRREQEGISRSPTLKLEPMTPDLYRIEIDKDGYILKDTLVYINRMSLETVIPLIKIQEELLAANEPENTDSLSVMTELVKDSLPSVFDTSSLIDGYLNPDVFQYNHIVFVIDVSTSMAKNEKLSLLKFAMVELVKVLRPEDKVSILTYSNRVNVLLEGVSGDNKNVLIDAILGLEAKGQSYGSEALAQAYDLAQRRSIPEGNNEIILASDGIFNSPGFSKKKEYRKAWYMEKRHGIKLTSIAFGNSHAAISFMSTLSERGGGSFLRVENDAEASVVLVHNLMEHSRR